MRWTRDNTLKFVELYRDQECLWNTNKPIYRNKSMRQKALEHIMQAMDLEGFGVDDVKQKIKNIRSTYNQEVQKIRRTSLPGASPDEVYKSALVWFGIMDQIMRVTKESSETGSSLDLLNDAEFENGESEEEDAHEIKSEEQKPLQRPPHRSIPSSQPRQATRSISSNTEKFMGTKRRLYELSQVVNEFRAVNQVLSQNITENEAFGRYVTSTLDKLPQKDAILAQNEIQNILTQYKLNVLSTPSCSK